MRRWHTGYTLIELLLVLAVLTVLATTSFKWYRHHWWERRVENTAIEMENFLASALNYQTEHEAWPSSHQDLVTCWQQAPLLDDFVQFYSPLHQQPNTLGQHYCYGALGTTAALFWVGLHLEPRYAAMLGPRLIALLPNAYLTSDPTDVEHPACNETLCFLVSEIPAQQAPRPSGTQVVGIGVCNPNEPEDAKAPHHCHWVGTQGDEPKTAIYAVNFNCPALTEKKLMASLNFLDVGKAHGDPYVLRSLTLETDCRAAEGCLLKIQAARSDGHSVTTGARGRVGASYLAYCQPISTST